MLCSEEDSQQQRYSCYQHIRCTGEELLDITGFAELPPDAQQTLRDWALSNPTSLKGDEWAVSNSEKDPGADASEHPVVANDTSIKPKIEFTEVRSDRSVKRPCIDKTTAVAKYADSENGHELSSLARELDMSSSTHTDVTPHLQNDGDLHSISPGLIYMELEISAEKMPQNPANAPALQAPPDYPSNSVLNTSVLKSNPDDIERSIESCPPSMRVTSGVIAEIRDKNDRDAFDQGLVADGNNSAHCLAQGTSGLQPRCSSRYICQQTAGAAPEAPEATPDCRSESRSTSEQTRTVHSGVHGSPRISAGTMRSMSRAGEPWGTGETTIIGDNSGTIGDNSGDDNSGTIGDNSGSITTGAYPKTRSSGPPEGVDTNTNSALQCTAPRGTHTHNTIPNQRPAIANTLGNPKAHLYCQANACCRTGHSGMAGHTYVDSANTVNWTHTYGGSNMPNQQLHGLIPPQIHEKGDYVQDSTRAPFCTGLLQLGQPSEPIVATKLWQLHQQNLKRRDDLHRPLNTTSPLPSVCCTSNTSTVHARPEVKRAQSPSQNTHPLPLPQLTHNLRWLIDNTDVYPISSQQPEFPLGKIPLFDNASPPAATGEAKAEASESDSDVSVTTPPILDLIPNFPSWREYARSDAILQDPVSLIKQVLKRLGLVTTGRKSVLISRIREEAGTERPFAERMRARHFQRTRAEPKPTTVTSEVERGVMQLIEEGDLYTTARDDLKAMCKRLGLRIGGSKAQIVARLQKYQASSAVSET
ncbi:hypothetical protein SARC_12372 [Sphaeroforma arctica JP610]|uniref:SAP domain-containing protein n=1 Tax=Sphaeroforma arctica JP610 TaxID=667725 RepID=A0A0L0FED5_9EUKA|nr:hypothetical protein SARC_12372 [Sphaeroforma arctica JP610]KNC75095.1 hypothetical protein SARC_12372 [Sphaeroforma arctica JP610]|eukprot:XP_014148997.1 hypothetical protein SARC_12372 [Sphaeroforma arctica JP610]